MSTSALDDAEKNASVLAEESRIHEEKASGETEAASKTIVDEGEGEGEKGEAECTVHYFEDLEVCQRLIHDMNALLPATTDSTENKEARDENKLNLLPTAGQDPHGVAAKVDELVKILDKYQELPHLLHPHLEQLVHPLIHILIRHLPCATEIWQWEGRAALHPSKKEKEKEKEKEEGEEDMLVVTNRLGQCFDQFDADAPKEPLHLISRALYYVTKTAGEKASTSHFPNDVKHFEDVFYTLRWWASSPKRQREWEVRYCLLVWLSNLVLVPFSMHLIDTNASKPSASPPAPSSSSSSPPPPVDAAVRKTEEQHQIEFSRMTTVVHDDGTGGRMPLSDSTLVTAVSFLGDSTKCRDGAALLVARLLTRPDSKHHRDIFFRLVNDVVRQISPQKRSTGFLWSGVLATLRRMGILTGDSHLVGQTSTVAEGDVSGSVALYQRLLPGVLLAVAKTMKLAQRNEVVRYADALVEHIVEELWDKMMQRESGATGAVVGDTLLYKLCAKVVQRLLLSMLKKSSASWKYHKTTVTSLMTNLQGSTGADGQGADAAAGLPKDDEGDEFDDDFDENCLNLGVGLLLEALSHKDTIVRWSAAKGIGRLCDRLPEKMASEVVTAVLELLKEEDDDFNDSVWHGGMLAIAELCRRGILVKDRLEEAVALIEKGLCYDIARGTYSVGEHVRDAASYTCWSMARAYDPDDLLPHVHRLSGALVVTSLLDRQVNVRRAASAAFQECVGRLGNFPHGIDLSTTMDFFSLSSLANAYLTVAPQVATYDTYRARVRKVLVENKLMHWDRSLRAHAAGALGRIVALDTAAVQEILPVLLERVTDGMVSTRHGAILGLAELVRHLPPSVWTPEQVKDIVTIFPRLDSAQLFRSRGVEHLREACCQLLEALASHSIPLPEIIEITKMSGMKGKVKTLGKLQEFLEDSWSNILDWLQLKATHAFRCYAKAYYTTFQPAFHSKVLQKMMSGVVNEKIPLLQRKGCIAALGCIPESLLLALPPAAPAEGSAVGQEGNSNSSAAAGVFTPDSQEPYFVSILHLLQQLAVPPPPASSPSSSSGEGASGSVPLPVAVLDTTRLDPECRRNAVASLSKCLLTLPVTHPALTEARYVAAVQALLVALQDYAADSRGDVGSFVRLGVLQEISAVMLHALRGSTPPLCSPSLVLSVLQGLLRVLFEKLDRVREAAGAALKALLCSEEGEKRIVKDLWPAGTAQAQEVSLLAYLVRQHQEKNGDEWSSPQVILSTMAPVLLRQAPICFAQTVADGLVVSAGDLTDHVRAPAVLALRRAYSSEEIKNTPPSSHVEDSAALAQRLSQTLVGVGERYEHTERIIVPLSRALDYLFNLHVLSSSVHLRVVQLLRSELKFFSTSIRVLLPMVPLLASLCRSPSQSAREQAWALSLIMIASRYPKVRSIMGTELYTALLALTSAIQLKERGEEGEECEGVIPLEGCLRAMQHLMQTAWDGTDPSTIRSARNQLYDMLGVAPPTNTGGAGDAMLQRKVKREMVASTYSALVQEAGY